MAEKVLAGSGIACLRKGLINILPKSCRFVPWEGVHGISLITAPAPGADIIRIYSKPASGQQWSSDTFDVNVDYNRFGTDAHKVYKTIETSYVQYMDSPLTDKV